MSRARPATVLLLAALVVGCAQDYGVRPSQRTPPRPEAPAGRVGFPAIDHIVFGLDSGNVETALTRAFALDTHEVTVARFQ